MKNYVQLIGRCGGDPELRETATGKHTAKVSVATSVGRRDRDGNYVETTTWHRVVGWNATAKLMAERLRKGSQVMVEGRLEYQSFEGRDGNKVSYTEIVAQSVVPCA